jgi:hypothetical protein
MFTEIAHGKAHSKVSSSTGQHHSEGGQPGSEDQKIVCSPSYADFRSRANAAMWLDLGHTIRGEHTREV